MKAGQDVNVKGSNVLADAALQLSAGRDVNILAAEEKQRSSYFEETKKSGLMGSGGIGFTIGKRQQSLDQQGTQTTAAASTVGSLGGNVSIVAGQKYTQSGSDVLAPKGDIDILAKKVDITEAQESATSRTEQKMKQSGLTVTLTSPIISTAQGVQQMAQAAQQTKSSRMQGLAAAAAGLSVYNNAKGIAQSVEALAKGDIKGAGFKLSVALGASQSQSVQTSASSSARGSTVKAGGNVNILATGAGQDSDLTLQGSSISAGKNALLYADDAIALKAAENRHSQASSNRSTSGSIGLSLDAQGISLDIAANRGQGTGDGSGTSYSNSQVSAANTLTLRSGGDTLLQGAVAKARRVVADVGGDLKIESLQDRSQYQEKQSSQGLSVSIPVTGTGKFGASVSASQANIRSNYQSAAAQSGIQAGDGGFSVDVQGNTSLIGGAITSTQKALDLQQNHFATKGALTLHDLENKAQYSANSVGGNLGMGSQKGGSAGIGQDSGNAKSLTTAGISGIAGDAAKRTGDAQQGIAPIFDKDAVRADVQAQVQITQMFGQNASKAVGDYAQQQQEKAAALKAQAANLADNDPDKTRLQQEAQKLDSQWGDQGSMRLTLHSLTGGLTGGLGGALGAAVAATAAPGLDALQAKLTQGLQDAGLSPATSENLTSLVGAATAAGLGAAAGNTAGAATALNADVNNRQLSQEEKIAIKRAAKGDKAKEDRLTKAACFAVKCWAEFPEGSFARDRSYVSILEVSDEDFAWVKSQQSSTKLFNYPVLTAANDNIKSGGGVRPLIGNGLKAVGGYLTAATGNTICYTGAACLPIGLPLISFGSSEMTEGATGVYNQLTGTGSQGYNPIRNAFNTVSPVWGDTAYDGGYLLLSTLSLGARVPLNVGPSDGIKRSDSIFGFTTPKFYNRTTIPIVNKILPLNASQGAMVYGVGSKVPAIVEDVNKAKDSK